LGQGACTSTASTATNFDVCTFFIFLFILALCFKLKVYEFS